jgi:glycosyltransferase involved in cell wall biosynthesis
MEIVKICIVSHFAFEAMTGGWGGGVERQTSRLSRWLAARGHDVSLLTLDKGQPEETYIDGVKLIRMCRQDAGLPGLRFLHPRWTSLIRSMRKADADVYYHNCAEYVTGQIALWCKWNGKRFVYSVASDPDCDHRLPVMRTLRERVLYRYGLRNADRIIVQTTRQKNMLADGFGLSSVVFPMPYSGPSESTASSAQKPDFRVLWVGRFAPEKRLERLLDLADTLRGIQFDVAGQPNQESDSYTDGLVSRARSLPNVTLHGMVVHERMGELYQRASLLCSTSEYEGFPNTFIEAWSYGVPVVSVVDPDDLIATHHLGRVAGNTNDLAEAIRRLHETPTLLAELSGKARKYYLKHHTLDSAMSNFESMFLEVTAANLSTAESR